MEYRLKNLKVELEIRNMLPCETKIFKINGIEADKDWFIDYYDTEIEEDFYGCVDRVVKPLEIEEVRRRIPRKLKKLKDEEIKFIQDLLYENLLQGFCVLCD